MTLSAALWEQVRQRAGGACEYCGVTEADCAGPLTVDHYRPQARGGDDELQNLLYCCWRCNLHKADYWPDTPSDPPLWNPRAEPASLHFLHLADATLHPLTAAGTFTLARLRLNRPALVEYRRRKRAEVERNRLQDRYREIVDALDRLHQQQLSLLQEQRALLEEQRALLDLLAPPEQ